MRFEQGSRVEVLSENDQSSVSWRSAEIISGNGHSYIIRYDYSLSLESEEIMDRVPRKVIRPCPPLLQGLDSLVAGDVVEVFCDYCWKAATVLKVTRGIYFLVKLLGSSQQFPMHKSNVRLQQSFEDGKWIVIGKRGNSGDVKPLSGFQFYQEVNFKEVQAAKRRKVDAKNGSSAVWKCASYRDSYVVSFARRKEFSTCTSAHLEAEVAKGREGNLNKDRNRGMPARGLEKADAVAYPRTELGETYMQASFSNQTTGHSQVEWSKVNGLDESCRARSFESNDSDIDACSVGSNSPNMLSTCYLVCPSQDTDNYCRNDELSSSISANDAALRSPHPSEEELEAGIHRLELNAYRCTLEALYASGPLSWEQVEMLTNLRLMLHISNDEHLAELRQLLSS